MHVEGEKDYKFLFKVKEKRKFLFRDLNKAKLKATGKDLKVWFKELKELEKFRTTEKHLKSGLDQKPKIKP